MTDVVITYVNCDDPVWRASFEGAAQRLSSTYAVPNIDGARYRDFGTLPLLVGGIRRFMPFVRNIYIVVSGETQVEDEVDGVTWVFHRDIIPEALLPTFNSTCIELFLYRIKGLAEQFIYFNDDMFPVGLMAEEDFYVSGKPRLAVKRLDAPRYNMYSYHMVNGMNLAADIPGTRARDVRLRFGHSATPMLRSTWETLWGAKGYNLTASCSPFRSIKNINQEVSTFYDYLSGNYAPSSRKCVYATAFQVQTNTYEPIADDCQLICVNDTKQCLFSDGAASRIREFIVKLQNR